MAVSDLIDSIEIQIRDYDNTEITEARLIKLIATAAQEAGALGWAYPITNATATLPSGGGTVGVPASYAWIDDLRLDSNDEIVPRHYWRLNVEGGAPVIFMEPGWQNKYTPGAATVLGWKRPKADYTATGDAVDVGLEAFLIDRAAAHALRTMAAGGSELDRRRLELSEIKMRDSTEFLKNIPEQYRILPSSRHVPLR